MEKLTKEQEERVEKFWDKSKLQGLLEYTIIKNKIKIIDGQIEALKTKKCKMENHLTKNIFIKY